MKVIRYTLTAILFVVLFSLTSGQSWALDKTSTGFYYPTGTSSIGGYAGWLASGCNGGTEYFTGEYHLGVDIESSLGDSVYPISYGKIVYKSYSGWGTGNTGIVVKHILSDGTEFLGLYGHVVTDLDVGDCVLPGKSFASIGSWSSGTHLHFGIHPGSSMPATNWGRIPCSSWPDTNGFVDPMGWIETQEPVPGALGRIEGQDPVYWLQNGKAYHVLSFEIIDAMVGMPGWGRDKIYDYPPDVLEVRPPGGLPIEGTFEEGPKFIEAAPTSEGLLIKQQGVTNTKVYVIENGQKRWITSEQIFNQRGYDWDDIIIVTQAILDLIPTGPDITDGTTPSDFYYLSGTLTDANGNPAQGYVYAYETSGANLGNDVWSSDGNYKMALFPGTYGVYASFYTYYPNGFFYITNYNQRQTLTLNTNVNLSIRAPSYQIHHVSGRVTDTAGNGLANVHVYLSGSNGYSSTYTSAGGSYDALVPEGTYSFGFIPPSGTRFISQWFYDLGVSSNITKNVSLEEQSGEQFLLTGTVADSNGSPSYAYVYAYDINGINPGNSAWTTNGTYQMTLSPGTYAVYGYSYFFYTNGYTVIALPQQTVTVNSGTVLNIRYPAQQFYHLRGKVTDVNNIGQPNVQISIWNNVEPYCSSYSTTSADGSYDALLIAGTYTMRVSAPPATYPPFEVKKIDITGDTTRNIRLSLSYTILDQAIALLYSGLDLALDVFDIISQGASTIYNVVIKSAKQALQIVLNWPGSEMKLTIYRPDGSIYGQFQSSTPPINVTIPNPEIGTWKCEVTAVEVPYDNYPFALVVGFTPNQPPVAKANGPYSGSVGSAITFNATGSYDPDGSIVSYEWDWNNDGVYDNTTTAPTIAHTWSTAYTGTVSVRVTDNEGLTAIDTASVTIVEDNIPPSINSLSVSPSTLWPPNHKMVAVTISINVSDNLDPNPVCRISSVSSNEPQNGLGDGDMAPDWKITGNLTLNLRSERSGKGNGRVYTITTMCTDAFGNSSTGDVVVSVPHDLSIK